MTRESSFSQELRTTRRRFENRRNFTLIYIFFNFSLFFESRNSRKFEIWIVKIPIFADFFSEKGKSYNFSRIYTLSNRITRRFHLVEFSEILQFLPSKSETKRNLPLANFTDFANSLSSIRRYSRSSVPGISQESASSRDNCANEQRGREVFTEATNGTDGSSGRRVEYFTACLTATMARQRPYWESMGRRRSMRREAGVNA